MADQLNTSNRVISSDSPEHLVVGKSSLLGLLEALGLPSSLDGVVVLVVADVHGVVDVVSDELGLGLELGVLGQSKLLLDLLLLCQLLLLLEQLGRVLLGPLLETNLLLNTVYLGTDLRDAVLRYRQRLTNLSEEKNNFLLVTHFSEHLAKGQ